MDFSTQLQSYMKEMGVSAKNLAAAAGISVSALSRYRNGERTPANDEEKLRALADGIAGCATVPEPPYTAEEIYQEFSNIIGGGLAVSYEVYIRNLKQLMEVMGISNNELSRELAFDASYISRILSGKRRPSELRGFNQQIVSLVNRKCSDRKALETLAGLLKKDRSELVDEKKREEEVYFWLGSNKEDMMQQPVRNFLAKIDAFDLEEYNRMNKFDEMKIPSPSHVSLPKRKVYIGLKAMMEAQLDFFRLTVTNKSEEPVFLYNDISMREMMQDADFTRKWIYGMSALLRRGLKLQIIHDVHRPMTEMMQGLETYIPMYMAGQIEPFYLTRGQGDLFSHLLWVSGGVVLMGEALSGYPMEGMHSLTNHSVELKYARKRAKRLKDKALPLMRIYKEEDRVEMLREQKELMEEGERKIISGFLPFFAMGEDETRKILEEKGFDERQSQVILRQVNNYKRSLNGLCRKDKVRLEVPEVTAEEFRKAPVSISFAGIGRNIICELSYQEYQRHLEQLKKAAKETGGNLEIVPNPALTFRNLSVSVIYGKAVVVTKSKAPLCSFIIRHPNMVRAFEQYTPEADEEEN